MKNYKKESNRKLKADEQNVLKETRKETKFDFDFSGLTNDGSGKNFDFDDIPGFRD